MSKKRIKAVLNKIRKAKPAIRVRISKNDPAVGYIYLPNHPKPSPGCVDNTISITEVIPNYKGVPIYLDFKNGELIGIEIIP